MTFSLENCSEQTFHNIVAYVLMFEFCKMGIVVGVLQIGNVFVGQMKQPLRLATVQEKFMFEKWHTSNTHQVV